MPLIKNNSGQPAQSGLRDQRTFTQENLPPIQTPHGKGQWVGGPSVGNIFGTGQTPQIMEIVQDLTTAQTQAQGLQNPVQFQGDVFWFSESENGGSPSNNDYIQICPDDPNINSWVTLRPGRAIEAFPYKKLFIAWPATNGSTARIVLIRSAQRMSEGLNASNG